MALLMVFGCESNFKEVQKINFTDFTPTGEADSLVVKYTDAGNIKAVLTAPKMLDYASVDFPFTEFPKGMKTTIFDNKGQKTYVSSDYALSFKRTEIIDLRGHVRFETDRGQVLQTEQMYYDQKNQWFYTDKPFTLSDPLRGSTQGQGIDFDRDLKVINYQKVTGMVTQE